MTWVKISDDLWRHRKVGAIATDKLLPCSGLWALALSWVGANLTDGYLPDRALLQVAGIDASDLAAELVRVELWERLEGGYQFHDYLDFNPTANEILTAKSIREEAARIGGKARAAGAKRGSRGQFTSGNAGQVAGTADQRSDQPRIPSPVSPFPGSVPLFADAGASAIDDATKRLYEQRDAEDRAELEEQRWTPGTKRTTGSVA